MKKKCKGWRCGKMGFVSNFLYRLMVLTFSIQDMFSKPGNKLLQFGIQEGQTVVDYGCGPGRYIKKASELVGEKGRIFAADIHGIAIEHVLRRIEAQDLKNVVPVLLKNDEQGVPVNVADMVYALDMFHQVNEPVEFLSKIYGVIKKGGFLYLEDGHQARKTTLDKVNQSGLWQVDFKSDRYLRLTPLGK
jgi:ubiquinone/menaquinone biosynthesis C-methylase UbiE